MVTVTTSGTWTSVSAPLPRMQGLNTKQLSWGDPYRPQNPQNKQSGYSFEGVSGARVPLDGTEFKLGTFTHSNYSILTSTPRFQVVLKLALRFGQNGPSQEFNFTFNHNETPNTSGPVPDEVLLPNPQSQEIVTLDGTRYMLHLSGFRQDGKLVLKFISAEDRSNSAEIYAKLVAVPVKTDGPAADAAALAAQKLSAAEAARAAAEAAAKAAEEARAAEAVKAAEAAALAAQKLTAAEAARAAAEAAAKAAEEARAAEAVKAAEAAATAAQAAGAAEIPVHNLLQEQTTSNCSCWIWIAITALLVLLIMSK